MKLRDRIVGILGDAFPDEAEGLTNHLMYFITRSRKTLFLWGMITGAALTVLVLKWLS